MIQECSIKEILEEIGYKLTPDSNGWRSSAIYRNGSNETSLLIRKDGSWHDFVECIGGGNIDSLIKKTLNFNDESLKNWLQNKKYSISKEIFDNDKHKIKMTKIFDSKLLLELMPDFSFYEAKGISVNTLREFQCGLATKGKMKGRFVFPIMNSNSEIIGFSGRDTTNNSNIPKWKHLSGGDKNWVYPAFLNKDVIKEKSEVILVEGVADVLTFFECDIRNALCLFGLQINLNLLNYLLRINIQKICISTNNDEPGMEGAEKLSNKLNKYFDSRSVIIKYPPKEYKDFNECLIAEGKDRVIEWYNS